MPSYSIDMMTNKSRVEQVRGPSHSLGMTDK
jgi:hypothetical protein